MALPQGVPDFVGGDPELVEVILDFPAPVTRALGAEGVETCVDFVGLWGTAEAFLQFFQAHLGYVPDAELRMDAARGWSRIAARARQQKASAVTVVSAQRLSVYPCRTNACLVSGHCCCSAPRDGRWRCAGWPSSYLSASASGTLFS